MIESAKCRLILAGLVASGITAGAVLWHKHGEAASKTSLAAEIQRLRAARPRPAEPAPTPEEATIAALYALAVTKVRIYELTWCSAFDEAMERVPWTEVPLAVDRVLDAHSEALALVDRAVTGGDCRFGANGVPSQTQLCNLLMLLHARGHAALARGEPVAAATEVQRLLRAGAQLSAAPRRALGELWNGPLAEIRVRVAEERAANLLVSVATAKGLPREVAPLLAAAARGLWRSAEAHTSIVNTAEEVSDDYCLILLSPGFEEWKERHAAEVVATLRPMERDADLALRVDFERVRRALVAEIGIPSAAGVREYREITTRLASAMRRRDVVTLGPGGELEDSGQGFLRASWFRGTVRRECRNSVSRAAAAIRSFQLDSGRPPRDLRELAGAGFEEVVVDPFDGKPLDYEVRGDAWHIRSRVWEAPKSVEAEDRGPVEVQFPRSQNGDVPK